MSRVITAFFLSIFFFASCRKPAKTTSPAGSLSIPFDLDALMPTWAYIPDQVPITGVSGVLIAYNISGKLKDTSGNINPYLSKWEICMFANSFDTTLISAGDISINNTPLYLPYSDHFFYTCHDSSGIWNEHAANHWQVSGSAATSAFSFDIDGTMPSFTGTFPDTISTDKDYSITFNSSNTYNGDYAYAILYSYATRYRSDIIKASGGTITFKSKFFAQLKEEYLYGPHYIDTHPYYGGLICVVVYSQSIQTINGKKYAFIKQKEVLGIVNFL